MDDTQQTQQPTTSAPADTMSSMGDVAGMTPPPPAPVMPDVTTAAPTAPDPMPDAPSAAAPAAGEEDYSYAEDVLNEILDSLDRMESKLEAIEKKLG